MEHLKSLCAKEVAQALGVSPRLAQQLMQRGEIESYRVGAKLWRTTRAKVAEYQARRFEQARRVA